MLLTKEYLTNIKDSCEYAKNLKKLKTKKKRKEKSINCHPYYAAYPKQSLPRCNPYCSNSFLKLSPVTKRGYSNEMMMI